MSMWKSFNQEGSYQELRSFSEQEGSLDFESAKKRFDICIECDKFSNIHKICLECGCYMTIKTTRANESCPIGKW